MRRRQYIALAAAGLTAGIAGAGYPAVDDGNSPGETGPSQPGDDPQGPPDGEPLLADVSLPVPESDLDQAAPRDGIPAIVDPVFDASWREAERDLATEAYPSPSLSPDERVIGVSRDGHTRAYPLKLLARHEVVNDTLGGPLLITYCPICRSGLVADRRVDGGARTFGVSGYLFQANLVLYDQQTGSLWSQLLATAIRGPATGTELTLVGSTTATWEAWRAEHPDTEVLLPPPVSGTVVGEVAVNYDIDPYADQEAVTERYPEYGPLGELKWSDTRLPRRAEVIGVSHDGEAVAYPRDQVRWNGPINDTVGGRRVVVALADDSTLVAYDRRVDGETLRFTGGNETLRAGGSRWRALTGAAMDGPHEGTTLESAADVSGLYWAAWFKFNPETTVYDGD